MTLQLPKLISHRGAAAYAPENTLISFEQAKQRGATWVEFDVMLTADGTAIVMHDDALERTTNGHGLVAETRYAEIAQLDAGGWFDAAFTGVKVPTFEQVLTLARQLQLNINVEIKPTAGQDVATAKSVLAQLKQHWPLHESNLMVSCFSAAGLRTVQSMDDTIPLCFAAKMFSAEVLALAQDIKATLLALDYHELTQDDITAIHAGGLAVGAYTINDVNEAQRLLSMGVAVIYSDYPDLLTNAALQQGA